MMWPPPVLPDSDMAYDEYTDAAAGGDFDPDGLQPACLPGRPDRHFPNRRASRAASPAPRWGDAGSQRSPREVTPPPRGASADLQNDCGAPVARDAA